MMDKLRRVVVFIGNPSGILLIAGMAFDSPSVTAVVGLLVGGSFILGGLLGMAGGPTWLPSTLRKAGAVLVGAYLIYWGCHRWLHPESWPWPG